MAAELDGFTQSMVELQHEEYVFDVGTRALAYAAEFVDPATAREPAVQHRFYAGVLAYNRAAERTFTADDLNGTEAELLQAAWAERRPDEPMPRSSGHSAMMWLHLHRLVLSDAEAGTYGSETWQLLDGGPATD